MNRLLATYRLQLHGETLLADVRKLVPYLHHLGATYLYLSPALKARSGSSHGYDVVDPTSLDPELGSEADFDALVGTAHRFEMGLLLDIVPNHMATGSENRFWEDVLTHGPSSRFAAWFDIDWDAPRPGARNRITIPVLGDRRAREIRQGALSVAFTRGRFRLRYHDQSFPLNPRSIPRILRVGLDELREKLGPESREIVRLEGLIDRLRSLPSAWDRDPATGRDRIELGEDALDEVRRLYRGATVVRAHIRQAVSRFHPEIPGGTRRLERLLSEQLYRLVFWRRASRVINYRRFFTMSDLIALRVEDPEVFRATHDLVLDWIESGRIDGLRIDHLDGLRDPAGYLEALRDAVAARLPHEREAAFPIFVEKILARDERLPETWPIAGTTGYEFLNDVEDLFIDPHGYSATVDGYRRVVRRDLEFTRVARAAKRKVLRTQLAADVRRLARSLQRIAARAGGPALELEDATDAVVEAIVGLPVYRTYIRDRPPAEGSQDLRYIREAVAEAREHTAGRSLDLLVRTLELADPRGQGGKHTREQLEFVHRFQQTCVPAAAKGVEDTALYLYMPLVSRNEVGGEPQAPIMGAAQRLHESNERRGRRWPYGLLCTSTHDTKRSADVRARLDVLSEIPEDWLKHVRRWRRLNADHRTRIGRRYAPDANTEYLFYQTLAGIWPLPEPDRRDRHVPGSTVLARLRRRLRSYMQKAAREAKERTSWIDPNPDFESALDDFIVATLSPGVSREFLNDFGGFAERIQKPGLWNALARMLIHLTAPGIPDIYQGDELWNFALVDPDNRRPVDFALRRKLLNEIIARFDASPAERERFLNEIVDRPEDDRLKLHVLHRALHTRRTHPQLFLQGGYEATTAEGETAARIFAFTRRSADRVAIIVVPRLTQAIVGESSAPIGDLWLDTTLHLPTELPTRHWRCALTDRELELDGRKPRTLPVASILNRFPVALLLPGGDT